jgi:hypothetical protein
MSYQKEQSEGKSSAESSPPSEEKVDWNYPKPEHLPRPTYWPLALAFGIVLIMFGIVTTFAISGVGLIIFAVALGGWIGELRHGD